MKRKKINRTNRCPYRYIKKFNQLQNYNEKLKDEQFYCCFIDHKFCDEKCQEHYKELIEKYENMDIQQKRHID